MGSVPLRRLGALVLSCLAVAGALAQTVPPGFSDVQLVPSGGPNGVILPTAVAYEPGAGHLWICEKGPGLAIGDARIRRRDAGTLAVTTALTISVDSRGERGILGIAFDPDFLDPAGLSRLVYVYYTAPTPLPHNRVSRFTESGGVLSAEQVILEGPNLNAEFHNGGCLRFRSDGTLFVSMGDDDTDADANPLSRDMSDLRGKILRINRDGTVPADNPFLGSPAVRPEIYEFGLRNPWRFHFDSDNDALFIADVGEACFESVFLGLPGADHGYPCFEGIRPFRACSGSLPAGSVTFPIYWYGHAASGACGTPPVLGNSITGGPVYRATAFPAEYRGNYYFADYGGGWIRRGRIAGDGSITDVEVFVSGASGPVDLAVSPSGCLTYAAFPAGGGIHDVCFVGGVNGQPEAVASAVPVAGLAPLDVQFTGSLSSDPDLDPLAFAWDFGDTFTDTVADPLHQYAADGVYQATLTVDDQRGAPNSQDSAAPIRIVVGNTPPLPLIIAPADRSEYDAGALVPFSGIAVDAEDGSIPAASFEWTVVFHHDTHQHPFLGPIRGVTAGQFTVPDTGEDSSNVYYRIWLSVTDSGNPVGPDAALEGRTFVDIVPNVTTTTLVTDPPVPGLQLGWDGTLADAPHSHASVAGFRRRITAPTPQVLGPDTWEFVAWSDAGAADHVIAAPSTDATITATFRCLSGPGCVETACGDAADNDFDGLADCADPDCAADPSCIEAGNCGDGIDNDLDGVTDCADSECAAEPSCIEAGNCADGIDNDVDGATDCADPECATDPACVETGLCQGGVDDDGDTLVDCADPDCVADPACIEAGNCGDAVDNDLDGDTDCADADCAAEPACIEAGNCTDGVDNDLDGDLDCADADCSGDPACVEVLCADGLDDEGDTLVDCADPDCLADAACQDLDGDGVPIPFDCNPLTGTEFYVPPEIARLDVVKVPAGRPLAVRLSWTDQAPLAGSATAYDVASALVSSLGRPTGADAPCVARDQAGTRWDDSAAVLDDGLYYLVRGGHSCGEGPWGSDSLGAARPACP